MLARRGIARNLSLGLFSFLSAVFVFVGSARCDFDEDNCVNGPNQPPLCGAGLCSGTKKCTNTTDPLTGKKVCGCI